MIWVTSQPDEIRFIWETMVQEKNFDELGVDLSTVYCIFGIKGTPSIHLEHLKITSRMNIIWYQDYVEERVYKPAIQFHLLKQFYKEYKPTYVFHIDSDVIMRELPAFTGMLDGDWHVSEASCYLDYGYLKKHDGFVEGIEETFGITETWLREHQMRGGGVGGPNYLMCGIDETFWEEVEELATQLHHRFYDPNEGSPRTPKDYEGKNIQIWTAGMWAWVWTAWRHNIRTVINEELRFVMSDHLMADYTANFFHNTGGNCVENILFNKGDYTNIYPFCKFHVAGDVFAQNHYLSYVNLITQELDKNIGFVRYGDNVRSIPTWWVIEGEQEPTHEEVLHLSSIKNYKEPVQWNGYNIRRKLYGHDQSHLH